MQVKTVYCLRPENKMEQNQSKENGILVLVENHKQLLTLVKLS